MLGQIDSDAANFLEGASAENFAEFAFEGSALDGKGQQQFADADPFACMGENEAEGAGDVGLGLASTPSPVVA